MPTPFWQYSQKSMYRSDKWKYSNIKQCVNDWKRDRDDIKINGKPFNAILEEFGFSAETLTDDQLIKIWQSYLPQNITEAKQNELLNFFAQIFHQGGVSYALSGRLNDIAVEAGHLAGGHGMHVAVDYFFTDNKLVIKEMVNLDRVILNPKNKEPKILEAEEGQHLVSGAAVYTIDFAAEKPSVECNDLTLNHHNNTVATIFDTRDVLTKIIDFIKSILGMNKLADPDDNERTDSPKMG